MYSYAFEAAVDHAMLYEVGGNWDVNAPGALEGNIHTPAERKAVGYTNDPLDPGGETKYGIAQHSNPDIDVTDLDWETAKEVYYQRYWLSGHCDKLPSRIAVLHFDGCVNHGIGRANKFLQSALGVDVDGMLGTQTLDAANTSDEFEICEKICDLREQFYRDIVKQKPNQSRFLKGWLRRINEMHDFTCDPNESF